MNSRIAAPSGPQRGLWFLDRWNPGAATYNVPWVIEFDGAVDAELLRRCLDRIVARHEALRTTFTLGADGPLAVVHDRAPAAFTVTDLDHLPTGEQGDALRALLDADAATGFDLESGPLLRARLVTGSAVPTTLVLLLHHIVWDGWSETVFEGELAELYTAAVDGRDPVLPELPAVHTGQATGGYEEHLAYWRDQLRGAPARLDLPADRARSGARTPAGDTVDFDLPTGLATGVRKVASAEDATPFVVQLAAFAALLNRYTGAADLVVGTPVTTRTEPGLEHLVGYYVNILPLRLRVRRDATFRELVGQVRDTAFDAYAYLDVPFDQIVDAVAPQRSAHNLPLVQVVFGAHSRDSRPPRFGGVLASTRTHHNGTSKFDLTWSTFDDGELRGEVEYSTELFDQVTVRRMAAHWRALLADAVEDPDQPLWRLGRGPAADVDEVAVAGPAREDPVRCLHSAFEAAADRFPQRPAVTFGGETLSYAELDARANRLANALIAAGVRRGDRVGLLLERTTDVVVTILAVLKAGAAYVPVDLLAPDDRAAFVFGDTAVRLVVTDRAAARPWPVFDLTEHAELVAAQPPTRPDVTVRPDDLAYLIFTSGSTGRPKGVAVAHEQVARLMASGLRHFAFTEHDVWTLFHSYAFDWTVWELWGALHHGGRLVVVPYLVSRAPEEFAELLAAERVSCLCLTPSALRQLEATLRGTPRSLPALRHVMLGGEALDPALVRRWFALPQRPPAAVCNLYGITETTVHVTTRDVADAEGFGRSLIGEPMPHLAAVVLDERLQPCPVGVPGELYVTGGGLAHGYWGRPGLTAQRFLPHPGGRLYRTGDVACRLAGGGLEYLGRCDDQVKVRGFRIELGEIEAALGAHPAVDGCVVTVHESDLAAYVTGTPPEYPLLREFLARSLPEYMIPATVTVLDAIPLTVNGKVDRAALPTPDRPAVGAVAGHVEPSTPGERLLAATFSDVLGVSGVGATDNFFHLGGDSIRAVHLAGRLRDRGWTLSLPDLFGAPTPAALAPLLRPDTGTDAATVAFELVGDADRAALPDGVLDAYPMVSMQLSMIFHMELSGDAGGYHNVNSYRVSGPFDEQALRAAVAGVMDRHPVLRTSLDVSSYREPLQLVHADVPVPVEVTDLRALPAAARHAAVESVFDACCAARFDLRTPPLFRVVAQRLTDDAFQLTVAEHHAILDGWSFTSMLTEILERHAALIEDPTCPPAPPPASTFRDFVAAERAAAADATGLAFWRERLAGVSGELWPARPAGAEIPRTVEHVVPDGDARLSRAAAAAGVPVKAVALAAHVLALHAVTGRDRITTGLSVNGRLERAGGTEAYGLFLNTVPLVADLSAAASSLARALHLAELELLAHRRVPFARLARFMTGTRLDANFAFLRFHALGRLAGPAARIVDDRIGCEPTMRYEPTNFALGAALVQDPASGRTLLAVDHLRSVVPPPLADRYVAAYLEALTTLSDSNGGT